MTVLDRFGEILTSIEVELASSLPICNNEYEIMFFYSTLPNDEYSYKFGKVEHAFARNITTGKIVNLSFYDIAHDVTVACENQVVTPLVYDEDAYEAEDRYYEHYEEIFREKKVLTNSEMTADKRDALWSDFNVLVPDGALKNLYFTVGKEFFTFLKKGNK